MDLLSPGTSADTVTVQYMYRTDIPRNTQFENSRNPRQTSDFILKYVFLFANGETETDYNISYNWKSDYLISCISIPVKEGTRNGIQSLHHSIFCHDISYICIYIYLYSEDHTEDATQSERAIVGPFAVTDHDSSAQQQTENPMDTKSELVTRRGK